MKKFFIWKDKNCEGIDPEWEQIGGKEFYALVTDPANKKRKFIPWKSEGDNGIDIIFIEVTHEQVLEWRREEYAMKKYFETDLLYRKDTLSLDSSVQNHEEILLHEVIASPQTSVWEQAFRNMDLHRLRVFVSTLNEDERELLRILYFENNKDCSERQIADQLGIPQKTLNNRKKKILEKARKFLI